KAAASAPFSCANCPNACVQRAEKFGVTPEIQQKLESLEAKAQRAEELEYQREQQQLSQRFTQALGQFAQEKGADAAALEQFMVEHNVPNFEVAYNAKLFSTL
ncbi:hypothetical protein ACUODJ_47625, partial [Escherichia sp. HC-CC]